MAPILLLAVLSLICHNCLGRFRGKDDNLLTKHPEVDLSFNQETEMTVSPFNPPRILTVLTTYNARTEFIRAYREVAADRKDGLEPWVSEEVESKCIMSCSFPIIRRIASRECVRTMRGTCKSSIFASDVSVVDE